MRKSDSLLFVYGTLRAFVDIPFARLLRREARHLGVARVAGRLHDLGRYPGLTAARTSRDLVTGDVYRLRSPVALFRALDRYEAGDAGRERPRFVRVRAEASLGRGRRAQVWVYRYERPVRAGSRIRSGDYERHFAGTRSSVER